MAKNQELEKYSYDLNSGAFLGDEIVTVPDQIADEQRYHDRTQTVFPARRCRGGSIDVRLDGDAYSLWTPGTGDMIVRKADCHIIP
jgi:hypothetical protein